MGDPKGYVGCSVNSLSTWYLIKSSSSAPSVFGLLAKTSIIQLHQFLLKCILYVHHDTYSVVL